MSTKGRERVATRYAEQQAEALELLKEIRAGLEQHKRDAKSGRGINYGHVGDMGHYLESLRDVRDSLHHLGEYAPENVATRD